MYLSSNERDSNSALVEKLIFTVPESTLDDSTPSLGPKKS